MVSPGLNERGSGFEGVQRDRHVAKMPFGITVALLVTGTW